ncbi:ribonuclease H-like domain-containing protein [Tanacetum coccineum]|uniref:Ribonuclease H-like domain-containing protein n=1 Tax=Tanacetum coccineum TaxID=301880 RepID=A0ABQ4ZXJ2_9ASTR
MAFVSEEITSSIDELSTAYPVNSATGQSNKAHGSSSYVDEITYSFFTNQSSTPQLDHDDLEQLDSDDFEEMDLKWQVVMISIRINKFSKRIGRKLQFDRKEPVGYDKTKVECFNCHKKGHFARECKGKKNQEYKGNNNGYLAAKEELTNYALMAITSSKSSSSASSDTESISPKSYNWLRDWKEETVCDVSESDVSETVFDTSTSDKENSQTYDRFKKVEGFHAVPPPLSRNFIPPKADLSFAGLDDSVYTSTAVIKDAPKSNEVFVETPKEVKSSAPLIQDWDTDKGEYVRPVKHAKSVKIAKSVRPITPVKPIQQTEKPKESCSSPKVDKRDWNGRMAQNLGLDLISFKRNFEHEHVVMNPTLAGMRHHHLHLYIQRISLTGFPAQSVGSSNTYVLDLPCLLVLITGTSQSRQHGKSESDSYYLSD